MNIIRHILLGLSLVFFAFSAQAQVPELINNEQFRPDAKAAVDSVYNFNFEGAEKAVAFWREKYPEHPLWSLFEGIQFWWEILSDLQDTSQDEQFYETMRKVDFQAGKLLHEQPDHADGLIMRAIANGYLARQHANRSEWVTSINYGRKAMNAYERLLEIHPDLPDLKLAAGLKSYYLAHIPQEYPVVKTVSWALPDGNKEEGLRLIREASEEAIFARAEAYYFLGNINYHYEKELDVAVANFEKLFADYPRNNYYARVLVKSYYRQYQNKKALNFIDQTLQRWQENKIPFQEVMQEELWTWKGRILERQGQKERALEYFQKAFSVSSEFPDADHRGFYAVSGFFAGKILYEMKKPEEAKSYLEKASRASTGNAFPDSADKLLSEINS